jgi:uncharacterized repeat protein (TIGR01451 family)
MLRDRDFPSENGTSKVEAERIGPITKPENGKSLDGSNLMHNSRTRSIVLITSGTIGIGAMVLLAVALAQRDARLENRLVTQSVHTYPPKKAEGISLDPHLEEGGWPPTPIIRGNDSPSGSSTTRKVDVNNPFRSPAAALIAFANPKRSGPLVEPPPLQYTPLPSSASSPMPTPVLSGVPSSLPNTNRVTDQDLGGGSLPPLAAPMPQIEAPTNSLRTNTPVSTLPSSPLPDSALPASPFGSASPPASVRMQGPVDSESSLPDLSALPSQSTPSLPSSQPLQQRPSYNAFSNNDSPSKNPLDNPPINDVRYEPKYGSEPKSYTEPKSIGGSIGDGRMSESAWERSEKPNSVPPSSQSSSLQPTLRSNSGPGTSAMEGPRLGQQNSPTAFKALTSPSPGVRQLEGSQNPNIEIQKRAPAEVQVGLPATISLLVRNVGNATAFDVMVSDTVPKGAKLSRTSPQAKSDDLGNLVWDLGQFKAGAEQVLTMEIVPESEGELGSVASVQFAAQASVRTMSTLPKLSVKQTAASSVLGGDSEVVTIEVINNGSGTARNVRLEAEIPPNMRHPSGSASLDTDGVDLAPGESFQMQLELAAVSAGQAISKVRAVSDNAATFESSASINVIQPKLELSVEGPRLRYLERQATYKVHVQNTGTALARGIRLTLYLPRGLEFNNAANDGTYFPDQHAVEWFLEELASGKSATTELSVLPVQEGEFVLRMHGTAERVRAEAIDKKVQVEGQSELAFSVEDENDPIEKDGLTTYVIRVTNSGTRPDNDVQMVIDLPEGASVDQIHAPVNYQASGRSVVFAPIQQLQPRDQQTYRLSIRHGREGLHVLRAQLKSRNRPVAVTKEESTEVYKDQ